MYPQYHGSKPAPKRERPFDCLEGPLFEPQGALSPEKGKELRSPNDYFFFRLTAFFFAGAFFFALLFFAVDAFFLGIRSSLLFHLPFRRRNLHTASQPPINTFSVAVPLVSRVECHFGKNFLKFFPCHWKTFEAVEYRSRLVSRTDSRMFYGRSR